jgi:predicted CoA-substrate-specific enzyme activase
MNNGKIVAGIDAGHLNTKAVLMKDGRILSYAKAPTACDVLAATQNVLNEALKNAGVSPDRLSGMYITGVFRNMVETRTLNVGGTVPEYIADAKGALFLDNKARTVIDIGGNVHMAISFDESGNVLDVIENDKCAEGLGIFYRNMAKVLGVTEEELSELALRATKRVSVAIQCRLSAESEAIDLMCQGVEIEDIADAIARFIADRVAAMCTYVPLRKKVVVAGGLAKSQAVIKHLQNMIKEEVSVGDLPEYVGAIGAAVSYGGAK